MRCRAHICIGCADLHPDVCPAGRANANDGTEGKSKDLNPQSYAEIPSEISDMGHSLMISFPG
eukprot:8307498-Karenia_brevis.AAC.1